MTKPIYFKLKEANNLNRERKTTQNPNSTTNLHNLF